MNVYRYDEETKEYIGVETAFIDPLETELQGKEIYLLPANCTFTKATETKEGYKLKWNGESWEYEEIPKEPVSPEPTLDELKAEKLRKVDSWTAAKITGGFESDGVTYDSDVDTQITMQGIALNADTPLFTQKYPDGCPVRGYDKDSDVKTIHYLNGKQVMQWMADLSMHIGACKQEGWALQDKISKAKNKDDLDKIVVPH